MASVADPGRDCEVNVHGNPQRRGGRRPPRYPGGLHLDRRRPLRRCRADADPRGRGFRLRSRPTAPRSGPPRPTSTPGRCPRGSPMPSAGSATSTGRGRARMARPEWWPSSPSTSHSGRETEALRPRQADPRLRLCRAMSSRAAGRLGQIGDLQHRDRSRDRRDGSLARTVPRRPAIEITRSWPTCGPVSSSTAAWTPPGRRRARLERAGADLRRPGLTYRALLEEFGRLCPEACRGCPAGSPSR